MLDPRVVAISVKRLLDTDRRSVDDDETTAPT
jgi:hypothetical protein